MDDKSFTIRVPKRWVRIAMIVGVTALIVAPLTAVATHSFDDVSNDNTFHADIEWLLAADVTRGCNPPANTRYCPKDNVTREQMAAFMKRLAENQVVDADKVDGVDASGFVQKGEANSVNDAMIADEPGTASTHVNDFDNLTGAPASYASVTIAAPTSGYVILTASTYFNTNHLNGGGTDTPRASISSSPTAMNFNAFQLGNVPSNQPSGIQRTSISLVAVEPVTQGNHTFHLVADSFSQSQANANEIARRTLTAAFVPSAYGTVVSNVAVENAGASGTEEGR